MMRERASEAARRVYTTLTRGWLVKPDDSKRMQELTIRDRFGVELREVEHWQPYGVTAVPKPPADDKQAEVLIAYLGGSPSHPVVIATADRRSRPTNMEPGEVALHDDQGQAVRIGRAGIVLQGGPSKKPLSFSAGNAIVTIADGQVTVAVGGMSLTVLPDRVKIGAGTKRVKLEDDSISTKLYAE